MNVYFDNAATTKVDAVVFEAMTPYLTEFYGNPSSIHAHGRKTRAAIEKSRKTIAGHLNCSPGEIFFTSCGTESNNMILKGAVTGCDVKRIITSKVEHHCVLHTVEELGKKGVTVEYVEIDTVGRPILTDLESKLKSSDVKTLVCLMHANNELGTITDIQKVGALCKQYNAHFHSDTVQTIGHFPIDTQQIEIQTLTGSAHKFHGPKGIGFIYINADVKVCPFIHGGGQERNMRAGTENLPGIIGLAKAMDIAVNEMEDHKRHIEALKNYMKNQLEEYIPGISFNGDTSEGNLYTVLNCSFPVEFDPEMLSFNLDINGISCSGGSACSSGTPKPSHVLQALNHPLDRKALRFSFSKFNKIEEVDYVVEKLKSLIPATV